MARIRNAVGAGLMVMSLLAVPGVASAGDGDDEPTAFVAAINESRAAEGLAPLTVYDDLTDDAIAHSQTMASTGWLHHNPRLDEVTDSWWTLGENVGYGWDVPSLHDAFMESPGHRANILGDYNYVGVGVEWSDAGTLWVTVVFMLGPDGLDAPVTWEGTFADDDGSVHRVDIDKIAAAGITKGCNPPDNTQYCPGASVTRGEMAAFLRRILELPAAGTDHFVDDGWSVFASDIDALADAGVAFGCTDTEFCPDAPLTRGEMAEMLTRAFGYDGGGADHFDDDDGHRFEASIDALMTAGVTKGCNPPLNDEFCPERSMTRAEMASFLVRALDL